MLDLRQPVWISDLQFFPNDPLKIVTGTAHKQVCLNILSIAFEPAVLFLSRGLGPSL